MVHLVVLLLLSVTSQALLSLLGLVPYIGFVVEAFRPLLAFSIFVVIGVYAGNRANGQAPFTKALLLIYALAVAAVTFATMYAADYYARPVKLAQAVAADKTAPADRRVKLTYAQAADAVTALLRQKVGSDGIVAYAIYSERVQLSAHSYRDYVSKEFEAVDDLGGLIAALFSVVFHTIPMLLKWLLCDKLGLVTEAGLVGLGFWLLSSLGLTYAGWCSAD